MIVETRFLKKSEKKQEKHWNSVTFSSGAYINDFQSGFKPDFGTEIPVIALVNDLGWDWMVPVLSLISQ